MHTRYAHYHLQAIDYVTHKTFFFGKKILCFDIPFVQTELTIVMFVNIGIDFPKLWPHIFSFRKIAITFHYFLYIFGYISILQPRAIHKTEFIRNKVSNWICFIYQKIHYVVLENVNILFSCVHFCVEHNVFGSKWFNFNR